MGLPFGCYKAKYFKPSFCESRFWVDHVLYGKLFVKSCNVMYAGVFLLNHLSVRQGGSLVTF